MEPGLKRIRDLFEGRKIFNIPVYQRAFAWEERQLGELLSDIIHIPSGKEFFLGTLLFHEDREDSGFTLYDVVDGQQRLTSLSILISCILRRLESAPTDVAMHFDTYIRLHGRQKLRLQPADDVFFRDYILGNAAASARAAARPAQHRLLGAKHLLSARIKSLSADDLKNLLDTIEHARVLTYVVDGAAEAALVFETTNDRGKPLTDLERVKSFLMYQRYRCDSVDGADPDSDVEAIQGRFGDIYGYIESIDRTSSDRTLNEDRVLQYSFVANENWVQGRDRREIDTHVDVVKKRVAEPVKDGRLADALQYIDNYSSNVRDSFRTVLEITEDPSDEIRDLLMLGRAAAAFPLLIKTYRPENSSERSAFLSVVQLLERYNFRAWGITRRRLNSGRSTLLAMARDFDGDWDRLRDRLRSLVTDKAGDDRFEQYLRSENLYGDTSKRDLRYLFWHYENSCRKARQPVEPALSRPVFRSNDPRTQLSIEHIEPVNPRDGESQLSVDRAGGELLHSLGNLTLDTASANSSKSNQPFEQKYRDYFSKSGFKCQGELWGYAEDGSWTAESVLRRTEYLVRFAVEYWSVES